MQIHDSTDDMPTTPYMFMYLRTLYAWVPLWGTIISLLYLSRTASTSTKQADASAPPVIRALKRSISASITDVDDEDEEGVRPGWFSSTADKRSLSTSAIPREGASERFRNGSDGGSVRSLSVTEASGAMTSIRNPMQSSDGFMRASATTYGGRSSGMTTQSDLSVVSAPAEIAIAPVGVRDSSPSASEARTTLAPFQFQQQQHRPQTSPGMAVQGGHGSVPATPAIVPTLLRAAAGSGTPGEDGGVYDIGTTPASGMEVDPFSPMMADDRVTFDDSTYDTLAFGNSYNTMLSPEPSLMNSRMLPHDLYSYAAHGGMMRDSNVGGARDSYLSQHQYHQHHQQQQQQQRQHYPPNR